MLRCLGQIYPLNFRAGGQRMSAAAEFGGNADDWITGRARTQGEAHAFFAWLQQAGDLSRYIPMISLATLIAAGMLYLFPETRQKELESLSASG